MKNFREDKASTCCRNHCQHPKPYLLNLRYLSSIEIDGPHMTCLLDRLKAYIWCLNTKLWVSCLANDIMMNLSAIHVPSDWKHHAATCVTLESFFVFRQELEWLSDHKVYLIYRLSRLNCWAKENKNKQKKQRKELLWDDSLMFVS